MDGHWALICQSLQIQESSTMNAQGGRHDVRAFGVGDIRLTAYKWLFDENVRRKGNIQVGLGIKFPTGNYHSVDYWYYSDKSVCQITATPA